MAEQIKDLPPIDHEALCSIAGNAMRMAHYHRPDLLFCYEEKDWNFWDGKRWKIDNMGRAKYHALNLWEKILAESRIEGLSKHLARELFLWGQKSMGGREIDHAVDKAKSLLPATRDDWDTHKYLLCCGNGIIDLRTGELKKHDRELKLRMMTPVPLDFKMKTPLWLSLIREWQPSPEMQFYLQSVAGYSASGDIGEQSLFIHFGEGANGKSTFLDTIKAVLGEFSGVLPIEALLYKDKSQTLTPELAAMHKKRFVNVTEPEISARISETFVKRCTGDSSILVNPKHVAPWEMYPEFKIHLQTNHQLRISGTDEGIWRRMKHIEWPVKIAESKRIKNLLDRLQPEFPGILAWIVEGHIMMHDQGGLQTPDQVRAATLAERSSQDVLGVFISNYCVLGENETCSASYLYRAFVKTSLGDHKPMGMTYFGRLMKQKFKSHHGFSGTIYEGLSLKDMELGEEATFPRKDS